MSRRAAGATKCASCHAFRQSFTTQLLKRGYDIRAVQDLLGHTDERTTMIYAHVLGRGALGARSLGGSEGLPCLADYAALDAGFRAGWRSGQKAAD